MNTQSNVTTTENSESGAARNSSSTALLENYNRARYPQIGDIFEKTIENQYNEITAIQDDRIVYESYDNGNLTTKTIDPFWYPRTVRTALENGANFIPSNVEVRDAG